MNAHQAEQLLSEGLEKGATSLQSEGYRYGLDPVPSREEFQKHCHLVVGIRHLALGLGEEEEKLAQKVQMYVLMRKSLS